MANIDRLAYNRAGQLFTAANVSAKSVIAVTTAMTGVILYNPNGSNKTLFVLDYGFSWTTVPGAVHNIGLGVAIPSVTVASSLTAIGSGVQSGLGYGNASTSAAAAYDAATLAVAPVARRWAGGASWGSSVGVSPYTLIDYVDGAVAVPPGGAACLIALTTTAVGVGHICWIEV